MKRLGANAYLLELPLDLHFSPICNIDDLNSYYGLDNSPREGTSTTDLPVEIKPLEIIEDILNDQVMSTRRGGYKKFLVKWKYRPISDLCW